MNNSTVIQWSTTQLLEIVAWKNNDNGYCSQNNKHIIKDTEKKKAYKKQ